MMFKKKENIGFKGGFNLQDTYSVRFCNIVEKISTDSIAETFNFRFPDQKVHHVIVNLCPTEPWSLPNWVILEHKVTSFLNAIKEVRTRYFPEATCYVAINRNDKEPCIEAMNYAKSAEWMKVFLLDPKYPQDDPVLFTKVILGLDVGFGQDTMTRGVLILDAQTLMSIYESCILGNKMDSRFIAISGTGLKENEIIKVQLGTTLGKLLQNRVKEACKHRVFVNGPLRGKEITDLSLKIDWSINNVVVLKEQDYKVMFPMMRPDELLLTTNTLGDLRRCIYCNFCDDICPVDLEPALYYHSYMRGEKHKARLYNLEKCIECGLCSFICPAKLELLWINKECKALDKQYEKKA